MRFILFVLVFLCSGFTQAMAQTEQRPAPPANFTSISPFSDRASNLGDATCPFSFNCTDYENPEAMVQEAGKCAKIIYGFKPDIFVDFQYEGAYQACALPGSYEPKKKGMAGTANWPICCAEQRSEEVCGFRCYYYFTN